jgi:CRP-like cAMP-binding protein
LLLYQGQFVVEGKGKASTELAPGDFIGLANIVSKKPYIKTIRVASAQADFLSISADEITYLVDTDHQISSTMLRILAEAA